MTNDERNLARIRSFGLTSPSTFDIRLPRRSAAKPGASTFGAEGAFTLIELIVVIAIIIVLAGLILSTVGYVQKKGARSRAETEIAAMSAACESYKADNGIYPRGNAADPSTGTPPFDTDNENARTDGNPTNYAAASLLLYKVLSGDMNANRQIDAGETGRSYFAFKPTMLLPAPPSTANVTAIRDPFGNSYGYSTAYQYSPLTGYNPTFDLWSTGGTTSAINPPDQSQWIKNW
jgi:type II secretory pathway pseudopilin PulG